MSDITPKTKHRLEALPDEILLEIFQYIKPTDLLSFKDHNQRLNNVIRDVKLNIVVSYLTENDEKDLDYFMKFTPELVACLKLCYRWKALDLNAFQELHSLTLNCLYLSRNQFDQVFTIKLQYLERISISNVPHYFHKELLLVILDNAHFPSLKTCQFTGECYSFIDIHNQYQLPNNTIRVLVLSRWYGSQLAPLFNLLPNLHRFETNFDESINWSLKSDTSHLSLADLRVTLKDPLNDLDEMLLHMPNLKRLRVKGKINEDSVFEYFEKFIQILHFHVPILQRYDCELYYRSWNDQVDVIVIQQLNPLFNKIQCFLENIINRCYTTDLTEYPSISDYTYEDRSVNRIALSSEVMYGYGSDHNDTDGYCNDDD